MKLFVKLKANKDLQLAPDRAFMVKLLLRVQGRMLNYFGNCIQDGASWELCKAWVLQTYFELFIKGNLIREMVIFCFQKKECLVREFFDDVINAVEVLRYSATE